MQLVQPAPQPEPRGRRLSGHRLELGANIRELQPQGERITAAHPKPGQARPGLVKAVAPHQHQDHGQLHLARRRLEALLSQHEGQLFCTSGVDVGRRGDQRHEPHRLGARAPTRYAVALESARRPLGHLDGGGRVIDGQRARQRQFGLALATTQSRRASRASSALHGRPGVEHQPGGHQHLGAVLVAGRLGHRAEWRQHHPCLVHVAQRTRQVAREEAGVAQVVANHGDLVVRRTGTVVLDGAFEVVDGPAVVVLLQVEVAAVHVSTPEWQR